MLTVLAHEVGSGAHRDLWSHWNTDLTVLLALGVAAAIYQRGRRRPRRARAGRARSFWAGLLAVAIALVSPLDQLAADLASAHMVQHVLLVVVAAPLLAYSAPATTMLRGLPPLLRLKLGGARRGAAVWLHAVWRPGVAWLLHAATLWFWHASGPYGAALEHQTIHVAEHSAFLLTAGLFWSAVLRVRRPSLVSDGYRTLLVFTMGMQGVFLGVLLTFATTPWYVHYRTTSQAWGLDPLADQQLAGVIMWVPAGFVYVAAGLALVARWMRSGDGAIANVDSDWASGGAPELSPLPPR